MRKLRTTLAIAAMALATLLAFPSPAHAAGSGDEAAFLAKINALRASVGVQPLEEDADMDSLAQSWTQVMASNGDISHNPNLSAQMTANRSKLGENVGMGPSVDAVFDAFVASPHHYANLVDPAFNRVGVSVVWVGSTLFTTHDFVATRASSAPAPAPRVAPVVVRRPVVAAAPKPVAPKPVPTTTPTTRPPVSTTVTTPPEAPTPVALPPVVKSVNASENTAAPSSTDVNTAALSLLAFGSIAFYFRRNAAG